MGGFGWCEVTHRMYPTRSGCFPYCQQLSASIFILKQMCPVWWQQMRICWDLAQKEFFSSVASQTKCCGWRIGSPLTHTQWVVAERAKWYCLIRMQQRKCVKELVGLCSDPACEMEDCKFMIRHCVIWLLSGLNYWTVSVCALQLIPMHLLLCRNILVGRCDSGSRVLMRTQSKLWLANEADPSLGRGIDLLFYLCEILCSSSLSKSTNTAKIKAMEQFKSGCKQASPILVYFGKQNY